MADIAPSLGKYGFTLGVPFLARQSFGADSPAATTVGKRVADRVWLGDEGKFMGDAEAAGKLNARKDLLKKCDAFAVKRAGIAGFELKIDRTLKIIPHEDGALVVARTMPVSKSMGFSASLGAKEFLEMVALLESTL